MTRMLRLLTVAFALPLLASRPGPLALPASAAADSGTVAAVDAVGMTVTDMDRSVAFFADVLTFEKMSDVEVAGDDYERLHGVFGLRLRIVRMRLGDEFIELTEYLAPEGRPVPADSRSNDRWFQHVAIIVSDMERAYARLRANKVRHASTGPQRLPDWNKNAGGIQAFYFKDPDGHALEILAFPTGKGAAKWHRPTDRLFLGIDHTAIVVDDTDASLRFYRDGLGLTVAGESENYGTEQERLNNVFGARLRITGLPPAPGPASSSSSTCRPTMGGRRLATEVERPHCLADTLADRDHPGLDEATAARYVHLRLTRIVELSDSALTFRQAALVRDPDGHALMLVQR